MNSCQVIDWTDADSHLAIKQGWSVCSSWGAGDGRKFEIARIDEKNLFKDDAAAWHYVIGLVKLGDPLAKKALAFISINAPTEYVNILEYAKEIE